MATILTAFGVLAGLGAILGICLSIADKKLSVPKDEKLVQLEEIMPGANCGGCGFAGCSAYAEAVFKGEAQPGLCAPGGQELANGMGKIMGIKVETVEKKTAFVFCNADCTEVNRKFDYKGLQDCNAAAMLFNGDNACSEGCLHLGSCINVCPQHALSFDEKRNITVDHDLCIACGKCVNVCPKGVIKLIPASAKYAVKCNSHKNGAEVRKNCTKGCIGCKICEVKFPESGFKVTEFLASSDYVAPAEKAKEAADACPRKIITEV